MYSWPRHPDGRVKAPSELTPQERLALDRHVAERIDHELATADDGGDEECDG